MVEGQGRAAEHRAEQATESPTNCRINEPGRDLFGELLILPRPQGRPRHVPTEATRQRVRELHGEGAAQPAIAEAIGLTVPTMILNYHCELESTSQVWRRRAERDRKEPMMAEARPPAWLAQANELMAASTTPMRRGAGRLTRMRAALEVLNLPDRKLLLEALDEISRPMTAREIDEALIVTGLTRTDRKRLVAALKDFPIMLVARP